MKIQKGKIWKHTATGTDGNAILFGVNIFDYEWKPTDAFAKVHDPLYGQEYTFPIYTVMIHKKLRTFAAGEFSNCVWGFYTPKINLICKL